jgi:HTH-type transcriptional regulator/antitoxin HigA
VGRNNSRQRHSNKRRHQGKDAATNRASLDSMPPKQKPYLKMSYQESELKRVEAEIAKLLRKGDNLAPEEDRLLDLLSALVERYEDETEVFPASPPHRILLFLLEQNDLQQVDLVKVFGSSGRVSEVVNGKRSISKAQAKALGEFFKVSPELFI